MKVSAIVPIYNAEKVLSKCIRSIQKQTYEDIEIILVNDGSADSSLRICQKHKREDDRIILIDKENEGAIKARQCGLEESSGDYVVFVDADDWIHPRMIETLSRHVKEEDLDLAVCNTYRVIGGRGFIKKKNNSLYFTEDKLYGSEQIRTELAAAYLHGHPFPASLSGKMYRRSLLADTGKYVERIQFFGEDLFLNIEVLLKAEKLKIIKQPFYYYRMGGFTSKYMPSFFTDLENGYFIQKEIIYDYFPDQIETHMNGISIMLLNTVKTCLYNLQLSPMAMEEKIRTIQAYSKSRAIAEAVRNEGVMRYFEKDYLDALSAGDIQYLHRTGEEIFRKRRGRDKLVSLISKWP